MNAVGSNGASLVLGAGILGPHAVARFASGTANVTPRISDEAAKRIDRSAGLRDELVEDVTALHLLASCQALDLRSPDRAAPATREVHHTIRGQVTAVEDDRGMDRDVRTVTRLLREGALQREPVDHAHR